MSSAPVVLVVDDDESILEFIGMALSDEGYEVVLAQHGQNALDLILVGKVSPDLILLDVRMPVMGGEEFLRAYNEIPGPSAPIIAVTATRDSVGDGLSIDADGVLAKPFDLEELLDVVNRYTRRR